MPAIRFCADVFVEVLGIVVIVDYDLVKRILPFVSLQRSIREVSDHKVSFLGNYFPCIKI